MNNSLTLGGLLETNFKTLTLWDENTKMLLIFHLYVFLYVFLILISLRSDSVWVALRLSAVT